MLQFEYTLSFKKQYKKLSSSIQKQFDKRLELFVLQPTHPSLRVHPLSGKFKGYWSMNVNGDFRALYRFKNNMIVIFALIGTHSQLYR